MAQIVNITWLCLAGCVFIISDIPHNKKITSVLVSACKLSLCFLSFRGGQQSVLNSLKSRCLNFSLNLQEPDQAFKIQHNKMQKLFKNLICPLHYNSTVRDLEITFCGQCVIIAYQSQSKTAMLYQKYEKNIIYRVLMPLNFDRHKISFCSQKMLEQWSLNCYRPNKAFLFRQILIRFSFNFSFGFVGTNNRYKTPSSPEKCYEKH